jgi:glycosyltransferase involved in cell wall biosynthesis
MTNQIFINGRFLTKTNLTGVQRFEREIVWALDGVLQGQNNAREFILIAPEGTAPPPGLSRIKFQAMGKRGGHIWEQTDLRQATRGSFLVNLGATGVAFKKEQLTVIHDAAVYRYPQNYSFAYGAVHRLLGRILARTSRLGTVSEFSRRELSGILRVPEKEIVIIPNGYEHLQTIAPEEGIIDKLDLRNRSFFMFVGSTTPNKNLARAIEAFAALHRPDVAFVIVGGSQKAIYRSGIGETPGNVILPGRLSDGEIVALYRHAVALVFPSLYEGFGIPPLEAMVLRCPVMAARIPPVEEVCGPAVGYFNPLDVDDITARMKEVSGNENMRSSLIARGMARFPLFSWRMSAQKLLSAILRGSERP